LNIEVKIENMFLFEEKLIVVSKTSVYDLNVTDMESDISYKMIFNNMEHANTEKVIKDAVYIPKHESVYMMIKNDNDKTTIFCKFSLILPPEKNINVYYISKKVDRFEVDLKDPLVVYLVCQTNVFKYKFKDLKENFQSILKQKYSKRTLNIEPETKKYKQFYHDKQFVRVYSNEINKIKFFKFDNRMKYFYTHDNHLIKKCLFDTGEEVYTMLNKKAVVRNLWFAKKFLFMIRFILFLLNI
jgi:hypothetical protein